MAQSFGNTTVLVTQQQADCKSYPVGLSGTGLDEVPALALILDSLERIGVGPTIASIDMCLALESFRNATCTMLAKSTPGDLDPQKLYALIFHKLMVALLT